MKPFNPNTHRTGIVHIGPGAFHRAHQAIYTEDAMRREDGDWRITAISPKSTQTVDDLLAQDGAYTLVTRGAAGTTYRRIQVHSGAIAAARDPDQALAAITTPQTRIVSLTITEKAYRPDAGIMQLMAKAMARRRDAGLAPVTFLSCDNLPSNGRILRKVMLDAATVLDPGLADWLAAKARFPSSMIDRITPATTSDLLAEVARETGWADQIPVETEDFSQWVIEDDFGLGRPAWDTAGALLVRDVAPYENMKLRMLNGAHSMLAYAGHVAGFRFVRDVMSHPMLADQVARHMDAAATSLSDADDLDPMGYKTALLDRFRNPAIAHETWQITMDGSQKMPQRIFLPALDAHRNGTGLEAFAVATALWLRYLDGQTEAGQRHALRDPRETELRALPGPAQDRVDALCALPDLVPVALANLPQFRELSVTALTAIREHGILAALGPDLAKSP